MPKKKILHKGKPKHATEESEEVAFWKTVSENMEEEYMTVTDYESNKKYGKRLIQNNWWKYKANLSDFDCDDYDEPPRTDDFNYLLKTASSDCSHFEFNSEKLWKSESSAVPASKIFDLDVNVLSSGLACLPFYKRLGLDEKELSVEDKERFDRAAENGWKHYNSILEKLLKKHDDEPRVKNLENESQNIEESLRVKLDFSEYDKENEKSNTGKENQEIGNTNMKEIDINSKTESDDNKTGKNKQKIFFAESDENLEDWLDNVLGD